MLSFSQFAVGVLLTLLVQDNSADRIVKIGNDIRASASGIDVVGATFLMNDEVRDEGILFAYSAFFRTDSPLRFQIWRPVAKAINAAVEDVNSFRLITELRTIPSVRNQREDVYIISRITELCTRVIPGDRLGIFFEGPTGSVSYTFDAKTYTALAHTLDDPSMPHVVNEEVDFGTLMFPYDFSASAYTDTNLTLHSSDSDVACPQGLYIPNEDIGVIKSTTRRPSATGKPGATGATGPEGAVGPAGSIGATGESGATGAAGATGSLGPVGGDGATGPAGPKGGPGPLGGLGGPGATGPRGQQGYAGPAGPPGPAVTLQPIYPVVAKSSTMFTNPKMVMSLLIWLVALTIITVVLATIALIRSRRKAAVPDIVVSQPDPVDSKKDNRISGLDPEDSWMNTLKEQSHHDVYLDTLDETGGDKEAVTSLSTLAVKDNNNLEFTPTGSETELMHSDSDSPANYELKNY